MSPAAVWQAHIDMREDVLSITEVSYLFFDEKPHVGYPFEAGMN